MKLRTIRINTLEKCAECGRVFDLMNTDAASEWYYGHDCEPQEED